MSDIRKKRLKKHNFDMDKYFLPILSVIVCFILGIWFCIDSSNYIPAQKAVVEGKLLTVASKSQGYILQTYIDEGQEVRKGDLLMEIDPSEYEYKLRKSEDRLREIKSKLNELGYNSNENSKLNRFYPDTKIKKSMFDFSSKDLENYAKISEGVNAGAGVGVNGKNNDIDNQSNENKNEEINNPEKQADTKKEPTPEELIKEAKILESEIEQLKLNLSYTKIYAPQDGTVSVKHVRTGEYTEIAQTVCTIIPKRIWVSGYFNDNVLPNIKDGQTAVIKVRKYPNRKFKGIVDYTPNLENKNITDKSVRIMFTEDYSEFNILPGTMVELKVKTE